MTLSRFLACALLTLGATLGATLGPTGAEARGSDVETVAPQDINALVKAHRGLLIVSISSLDSNCRPCMGANAKFRDLARGQGDLAKYVEVAWRPWRQFPPEIRTFLSKYDITLAVPVRLAFQDGELVDKFVGEPPDPPKPSPQSITGTVDQVSPNEAAAFISRSRGLLVVMFSSFETRCAFCMRANPVFETLAKGSAAGDRPRFVRVMYRPWEAIASDAFAQANRFGGLPVFVTYRDGQAVRRRDGIADPAELQRLLLEGVN